MAQQIYNEGRVVGLSAYEVYVKQHMSEYPDVPPATEREWLSTSIGMGSSMLLKFPKSGVKDSTTVVEIELPENCKLCAANTIVASFFNGAGNVPAGQNFADSVTEYGTLISSTQTANPSTSKMPTKGTVTSWTDAQRNQLKNYIKIVDGLVVQPGTWDGSIRSTFVPDLSKRPILRFTIEGVIDTEFYMLLTGFVLRNIISGTAKFDKVPAENAVQNGEFLGPGEYPWANKIVFSVPSAAIEHCLGYEYIRKIPASGTESEVSATPIIDMESARNFDYYSTNFNNSTIGMNVTKFESYEDAANVLVVYSRNSVIPPALFGAMVNSTGSKTMYPVDVQSPGTVKLFHNDDGTKIRQLELNVPNNVGFTRDPSTYVVSQLNQSKQIVPVSDNYYSSLYGVWNSSEPIDPFFTAQVNAYVNEADKGKFTFNSVMYRRLQGNASEQFQKDYALSDEMIQNVLDAYWKDEDDGGVHYIDTSMYKSIPESKRSEYYYVLKVDFLIYNTADYSRVQHWTLVPVRKSDHHLDVTSKMQYDVVLPWFSETVRYEAANSQVNTRYLGTWWDESEGITGHQTIVENLPDIVTNNSFVARPESIVPANGTDGTPWQTIYARTKISDIFTEDQLKNVGMYSGYWNLSFKDLLHEAKLHNWKTGSVLTFYNSETKEYETGRKYTDKFAKNDIEYDAEKGFTVHSTLDIVSSQNDSNVDKSVNIQVPKEYISSSGPQVAIAVSGNNQTVSLAMADANNKLYPLEGNDGTISNTRNDSINWADLVEALAGNKQIDIMGELLRLFKSFLPDIVASGVLDIRGTGDSKIAGNLILGNGKTIVVGTNYIQFGNGLRLYIDNKEPSNSDGTIPTGSVGIGW